MAIRKAEGIEKIVEDYATLDKDEKKKQITVNGRLGWLEDAYRGFEKALKIGAGMTKDPIKAIKRIKMPMLSPEQISLFMQCSLRYEDEPYYTTTFGYFLSKLIQESYDAGNNSFCISTRVCCEKPYKIGHNLIGDKERMLKLKIEGDAGDEFLSDAKNIFAEASSVDENGLYSAENIEVKADSIGDNCGMGSRDVKISAREIGSYCCHKSENVVIRAEKIGIYCTTVSRNADVEAAIILDGCGSSAHVGRFITSDEKTLERLKKSVMRRTGNVIGLKEKNGAREWEL